VTSAVRQRFTEAEYLALERASDTKHEFVAGEILAMAGATPAHNMLAVSVSTALLSLARPKGCVVLNSDQRVHVPVTRLYAYPDVTVACGQRRYTNDDPPSLLNPSILVEVTSDTSEAYDRGTKFLHYQSIESLREYMIVSHRETRIDHYRRLESGQWLLSAYASENAEIPVPVLDGALLLADIYAGIDLNEGAERASS
jgi:Uma2 family endonuclease